MSDLILIALDTETTGLEQSEGHRLIEVGMVVYNYPAMTKRGQLVQRINPQRPISAGAQAIHGITFDELSGEPIWEEVAPKISKILLAADLIIAHNAMFDGPFIAGELMRVGQALPTCDWFCTMDNARWATFNGKSPKLSELASALDIEYDVTQAHGALYDTELAMQCFIKGVELGFYKPACFTTA